jgi:hypothetical protein
LVPADVDCTDLDSFLFNVERFSSSELVAVSSAEVIVAAIHLWCRAWKQRPAASLPNDDRVLASFARLPLRRFKQLRAKILHGFVLCSDGRFYHRVLAHEAIKAFDYKKAHHRRRLRDAERLRQWRDAERLRQRRHTPNNQD